MNVKKETYVKNKALPQQNITHASTKALSNQEQLEQLADIMIDLFFETEFNAVNNEKQ